MTVPQRAAERLGYLLATRPNLRRAAILYFNTHLAGLWSVVAAPKALASSVSGALNWTGIVDSHGVPLGAYYLSTVSTREAVTDGGPGLSADPSSWVGWLGHAVITAIGHQTVASWLQALASVYVVMITLALWLLRFAMSSTWLYWLATWFRPLFDVMRQLLADLWVFPICLLLALSVGAYHMLWRGHRGRGWGMMLSSTAIGLIGIALTRDPLTDLYSDNGLLNQGRNLGFGVAQAAMNNGPIATGGSGAQLQTLTTQIADATVRIPLQLWNFGTPIDTIGSCGNAWSAAILTGESEAPAHAMASCGAPQALSYAQHLDGGNLALGFLYCLLGFVFTFFVCYVAYSYVMVAGAAFLNAFLAVPAAAFAMIPGRPRHRAMRRLVGLLKHALLVFAYVTYISVAALVVLRTTTPGGYAAQVNMTHPLALLVMIALVSAVATGLFRWLKHELGDHTRQELTHTVSELVNHGRSGYDAGRRSYGQGQDSWKRIRTLFSTDSQAPEGDDGQLTGSPVPGRPSAGYPPRPNGRSDGTRQAPRRRPGPTPATTQGEALTASAAVAAAAPEVAVGVAVAEQASQRMPRPRRRADRQTPAGSVGPDGEPESALEPPAPTGRAAGTAPTAAGSVPAARRQRPMNSDAVRTQDDPQPTPPAEGRNSAHAPIPPTWREADS